MNSSSSRTFYLKLDSGLRGVAKLILVKAKSKRDAFRQINQILDDEPGDVLRTLNKPKISDLGELIDGAIILEVEVR